MRSLKIRLNEKEVKLLENFIRKGKRKAREIYRANILLLANKGERDTRIARTLSIHRRTVWRVKKRYLEGDIESALKDDPRPGQPKKYTERHEAEIIALACSDPPEGVERWTLELMTKELKDRKGFETINRESIRLVLKKAKQNLGSKRCGVLET